MKRIFRRFLIAFGVLYTIAFAGLAQTVEDDFNIETFRELATRAEGVVANRQASNDALEILRADLAAYRSQALKEQEVRAQRVATVQEQITALGSAPEEGQVESAQIAARRDELNGQLAEARAPLIVAQEAFRRADGLIGEIDGLIRTRQTTALLKLEDTPLNPTLWPAAWHGFFGYLKEIGTEISTQWKSETQVKLRKQNGPLILLFLVSGFFFLGPIMRFTARRLETVHTISKSQYGNMSYVLASLGLFVFPMLGVMAIVFAFDLARLFALRGDILINSIPIAAVAFLGANWFAHNLGLWRFPDTEHGEQKSKLIKSVYRVILFIGTVMAVFYIFRGLSQGADWPPETVSVIRFPFVVLLGYGLFRISRYIRIYLNLTAEDEVSKTIRGRILILLTWACIFAGLGGPFLAAIGYANAAAALVFSMLQTLALSLGLVFIYAFAVRFMGALSDTQDADLPKSSNGLYKALLAFALICIAIPAFVLIWGAKLSDIGDLWFALNEGVSFGETRISISDFLIFSLIFFIGYTLTRLLQSALRTSVLPNTRIEAGAQNALVTGIGYIGIFLAALIAIMSTGIDLSNLAIVAGALSVGIGFGLQAIVSNFVSGIILLIERPVKIGDWVEIGTYSGYVQKISVRSTSIETFDGASVIVPNADLIAGTVTNWTHTSMRGRVKVPVGVAYGTDPEKVQDILLAIAADHPMTLKRPEPWVVFMGFGADSLNFELRAIIRDVNYVLSTASDMNFEIVKRFAVEGIEIPFAQREVTIKNAKDFLTDKKR